MNKQDRTIIYQKTFNTKEGKEVIKDIEQLLLKENPFALHGDIKTDSLLREGARILYNHIINSMKEKKEKPKTAINN
jgi:hypothetical protein